MERQILTFLAIYNSLMLKMAAIKNIKSKKKSQSLFMYMKYIKYIPGVTCRFRSKMAVIYARDI